MKWFREHGIDVRVQALEQASWDNYDAVLVLAAPNKPILINDLDLSQRIDHLPKPQQPEQGQWLLQQDNTLVFVVVCQSDGDSFARLSQARKRLAWLGHYQLKNLLIETVGFESQQAVQLTDDFLSALLAGQFQPYNRKHQTEQSQTLSQVDLAGKQLADYDPSRRAIESDANGLARQLSLLSASELNPASYRRWLEQFAEQYHLEHQEIGYRELKKRGAGAFCAVAQGNSDPEESALVRLSYRPQQKAEASIALVGKGITMDTGGYNVKTNDYMFGMNQDMGGSAVVVGLMQAISRLQLPIAVDGWLAVTENRVGEYAYTCNEIVESLNGDSIEVVNTDAEGRMILADSLYLAAEEKPDVIMDFATLTGSCIKALGTRVSGLFTNQPQWHQLLIEAGLQSGERIWPMPIFEDYDKNIESDVADIRQCNPGSSSDHIDAARFLSRHVQKRPWIHIDLSAWENKGGLAHIGTETTGFGVRYVLELLHDKSFCSHLGGHNQ